MYILLFTFLSLKNSITQIPIAPNGQHYHFQNFESVDWDKHYIVASDSKFKGKWRVEKSHLEPYDNVLYSTTQDSNSMIMTEFENPIKIKNETLIAQFEVLYDKPFQCGGAYLMLYGKDNLRNVSYIIKFGPDLCSPQNHVYFNFTHQNKLTGQFVEHKLIDPPVYNDNTQEVTHLYTLIIRSDNSFEILVDMITMMQGNLLNDFVPPVNPPKEIDDPNDKKPKNFDDKEYVFDKTAVKPADWEDIEYIPNPEKLNPPPGWLLNEPERIPDPNAKNPDDWDEEFYGKWEAPLIDNPKCVVGCGPYSPPLMKNPKFKGVWRPPKIKNPNYKGKWSPRKILNPNYFNDSKVHCFRPIFGLKLETRIISSLVGFDNVLVSSDEPMVHKWNMNYYLMKSRFLKLKNKGKLQAGDKLELDRNPQNSKEYSQNFKPNHKNIQKARTENKKLHSENKNLHSENKNDIKKISPESKTIESNNIPSNGIISMVTEKWNSLNNSQKYLIVFIIGFSILIPFAVCGCILFIALKRRNECDSEYEEEDEESN